MSDINMNNDKQDTNKDTNPKDALGIRKVPIHCVSCAVIMEMGLGMMEGGRKYGTHNYRSMGVLASVYYDAAMRHLMDWWEGEDLDPDSGLSHVTKALSCLSVLRDSQLMENWKDDRPIRLPDGLDVARMNAKASEIIDKYPEPKEPFTEIKFNEVKNEKVEGGYFDQQCPNSYTTFRLCNCPSCIARREQTHLS